MPSKVRFALEDDIVPFSKVPSQPEVIFELPEDGVLDEPVVAFMVKDQLTKHQFKNLLVHFVKYRMTSPLYAGEKYQNYANALDLPLDKFWAQHFFTHMKTPGIGCVFAYSRINPYKIAGLMLAEIGLDSVKLSGGTVQNEGLLKKLTSKVQQTYVLFVFSFLFLVFSF
eukprot:Phypoly_transcript_18064.p1 GENE.Phypoly_transcript_18064~~Phypoly_transcript_18064.p1  ORF type:complete len:169 (+),score=23.30 Phypoly_transcript_18064:53-559(+)